MNRTDAREWVVKILYQYDISKQNIDDLLNKFYESNDPGDQKEFIVEILHGVIDNINLIDDKIKKHLKNWDISRIAKIDLAILRCSIYEILYRDDIPNNVSINEAVELAKKYSTERSPSFINGILGNTVKELIQS